MTELKKPEQAKTLLIWEGPERPHKKQDKKFYSGMISLVIVISIFLGVAGQFTLIIVLLSLLFATYALHSTPPQKTTYVLTTQGVEFKDEKMPWSKFKHYFVAKELDEKLINLDLKEGFLSRRFLIADTQKTMDDVIKILKDYLNEKPYATEKSTMQKAIEKAGLSLKE